MGAVTSSDIFSDRISPSTGIFSTDTSIEWFLCLRLRARGKWDDNWVFSLLTLVWLTWLPSKLFSFANTFSDTWPLLTPCFNDWSLPLAEASGTEGVPSQDRAFIH